MIIPAKRAPGNDIDVYLRPLIEELKELWNNRLKTFDSYSNEVFNMHAAILWTISDFPGLETLSGWNTHTGLACPRCNFDTTPKKIQGKFCFMNHRRWLNARHKFRLARIHFDDEIAEYLKFMHDGQQSLKDVASILNFLSCSNCTTSNVYVE